jgi:hypothetical protein
MGWVLSRESHQSSGVPTLLEKAEGHTAFIANARWLQTLRGQRPQARSETP